RHAEGCDWIGPDDSALIVILFDRGCHDARHTDAIASHQHRDRAPSVVEHGRAHGVAVLGPELEYVPHLDSACDRQPARTGWARIAGHDVTKVGDLGLRQIAAPVDACQMQVPAVGTADEVGEGDRGAIGVDLERKSYRAERSGLATDSLAHTLGTRH